MGVSEVMNRFMGYRILYVFFVSFEVLYDERWLEHWGVFSCGDRVVVVHGCIYCWSVLFLIVVLSSGFYRIVYVVVFHYGRYFICAIIALMLSVVGTCRFRGCRCVSRWIRTSVWYELNWYHVMCCVIFFEESSNLSLSVISCFSFACRKISFARLYHNMDWVCDMSSVIDASALNHFVVMASNL